MPARYDHRKLAFQNNPRWKKRRITKVLNLKELEENFTKERRGSLDVGGGLLGQSRITNQNNAGNFQKKNKQGGNKTKRRRGTVYITESEISTTETKRKETRRQVHYVGNPNEEAADVYHSMDGGKHLAGILEGGNADVEALQNIMLHLEEKQKKREQDKYGEDFQSIKERMAALLDEYTDSDEDDFDVTKLDDPDFFISKETKEKNTAQNEINKILDEYLEVCHDREDILSNVHESLNFDEMMRNVKSPEGDELDNVSSEISMTIEMIQQSSTKLNKLYNRLLKLYTQKSATSDQPNQGQNDKLRQLDLQKQVINKFKSLQTQKAKQKEKAETWKFAANEIVDLLKSVRQEGATDFEQLEKEFQKLLQAFTQQSRLIEDHEDAISKQKANIKKIEAMKEKLKNNNSQLQDEYDRVRVQYKTLQLKSTKFEIELQSVQEKLTQAENLNAQANNNSEVDNKGNSENNTSNVQQLLELTEATVKIEELQKQLQKVEKRLKIEQQKNKDLEMEKKMEQQKPEALAPSFMERINNNKLESESDIESNHQDSADAATPKEQTIQKKKCIKCKSFKSRLDELAKDLDTKREQIVVLSKKIAEMEKESKVNSAKTKNEPIDQESQPDIPATKDGESSSNLPTPMPSNTSNSTETNVDNDADVSTAGNENVNIIRSSTKQILVYQEISMEQIQRNAPVVDQETQTDFPERSVILKQRAPVPTQSVISKNYSSLVDEDIKDMAGRIYSYVNSIDHPPAFAVNNRESTEKINAITVDTIPEEQSESSTISGSSNKELTLSNQKATKQEDKIDARKSTNISKDTMSKAGDNQRQGTFPTENNPGRQGQTSIDKTPNKSTNDVSITRRGNESGFFDDSITPGKVDKTESSSRSRWEAVRAGVVSHTLRFLHTAAKKRCSYLNKAFQYIDPTNKTDEQIIKAELAVFAEHAVDMLDVISYSVKQMNECSNIPLAVPEGLIDPMASKLKESWHPFTRHNSKSTKVKFNDQDTVGNDKGLPDLLLPEITHKESASPKPKHKKVDEDTVKEMKAKVAEKKRNKVLDRHKKLVNKLRQSGVGLKQIYTILGISNDDQEEEMPSQILPRNRRKISLVGHGYRNDVLRTHDFHEEKLQRMTGLTMHGTRGVRGFSRRLSLVDIENRKSTVFPAIRQPKLAVRPVTFGNNFFQTRPLTPRGKHPGHRR